MSKGKILYPALIFLWAVFLCRGALVSGQVLMPEGGDHVNSIYGPMFFFHEWSRRGIFPLWNPLVLCGHPFAVNSITAYNFYHLLSFFFEAGTAYNILTFAGVLLGGLFLFPFLTRNGVSDFAAGLSSMSWMTVSCRYIDTGFFFMPLCFYLADLAVRKNSKVFYTAFIVCLSLYSLNANTQYFLYGAVLLFFYLLGLERSRVISGQGTWRVIACFALSAGLTMFYYVRLVSVVLGSTRSNWTDISVLLPTHLLTGIFPRIFYSPTRPELDFLVPRILSGLSSQAPAFRDVQNFISLPYVGVFSAAALFAGLFFKKNKDAFPRFFLLSALSVITYLVFQPLIYHAVARHIPILKGMTGVDRAFYVYQFSLVVLSAAAIDRLLERSKESARVFRRAGLVFLGIGLALFGAMALFRAALTHGKGVIERKISANLNIIQNGSIFIENASAFGKKRVEEFFYFFNEISSWTNPHVLVPLGVILLFSAAAYLYFTKRLRPGVFRIFLGFFILSDIGSVSGFSVPASSRAQLAPGAVVADAIQKDKDLYRVFAIEDKTRSIHRMFLRPQRNMIYGLATPDGYGEMYQKRYVKFYSWLTRRERLPGPLHFMDDFSKPLADFINCKYLVTNAANPKLDRDRDFEKILERVDYKVFRNKSVMPRAFVVHEARFFEKEEEMALYIQRYPERLKREVLLEGAARQPLQNARVSLGTDQANIRRYEPNQVLMDLELASDGYVVMSESFSPDWEAVLDGSKVKLELADYAFRAVRAARGKHLLRLVYRPVSLRVGGVITLGSFLLLIIVLRFLL